MLKNSLSTREQTAKQIKVDAIKREKLALKQDGLKAYERKPFSLLK